MARHGNADRHNDSRDANKSDAFSRLLRPDRATGALLWTERVMSTSSHVLLVKYLESNAPRRSRAYLLCLLSNCERRDGDIYSVRGGSPPRTDHIINFIPSRLQHHGHGWVPAYRHPKCRDAVNPRSPCKSNEHEPPVLVQDAMTSSAPLHAR